MTDELPELNYADLRPTRDYLQDATKVLGKLQQAYLPASPRDWHYGLEVTMRGICTQAFDFNGQPTRALIDLVRHKVRFGGRNWVLRETPPAELFKDIQSMVDKKLDEPEFSGGVLEYDHEQAEKFAAALWWMERQFDQLKESIKTGVASPVLLFPHHFDLSLAWFPRDNDEHVAIGFSTGDATIAEPYLYLSSYPDSKAVEPAHLTPPFYWQSQGFKGLALTYEGLCRQADPAGFLKDFVANIFTDIKRMA